MGALSVVVEDAQDLRRAALGAERVRNHGRELRCLTGLDQDGAPAQQQHDGSRQDGEPVPTGMHPQLVGAGPGRRLGAPHLRHRYTVRSGLPGQHPGGHPPHRIALRPDDHVLVVGGVHQLVQGGAQGPRDRGQLVEGDPPMAGLDPAEGGRAQVAAAGQVVERPAPGHTQAPDPLADQAVELTILRHTQETMSIAQAARKVGSMANHHDQHQHQHQHAGGADESAMAELLDLDAEVLHSYLTDVTAWIRELAADPPPRRILDLGSGTGTGTFALLERFERADAIALDVSGPLLHHLTGKARALGVAGRVRTVQADLDAAWPALDSVDLVWASSSLHHMADPDRVLTAGGLLVVAEMESFPRFLPDDLGVGRPGLEARCHAALAEERAARLPHLGSGWRSRLSQAGFTIEAERPFAIDLTPPLPASTGRYAAASLRRVRSGLDGLLSADDLATLDAILDSDGPEGVLRRDDP